MKIKQITILLFLVAFIFSSLPGEEVRILAKHKRNDLNSFIAEGDVTVLFGEYRIYADYIEYNRTLGVISARGKVTISSAQTVLSGEDLVFNVKKKSGIMYNTKGNSQPTVSYTADKMEQVDNTTMRMKKFSFTSCTQLNPRWKIDSSRAKIKKQKYIEIVNGFLKIKNIPVFYFPYMRYPLQKNGRATGFLFPTIKNSTFRGFTLNTAFYWDIKPNLDLTLYYDYYQKLGRGFAAEGRYKFKNSEGSVKFYLFKYLANNSLDEGVKNNPGLTEEERKAMLKGDTSDNYIKIKHKQKIKLFNTTIDVDMDEPSDPEFMRVFSDNFESVYMTLYRKNVSLSSKIGFLNVKAIYSKSTTYYINERKKRINEVRPSISVNIYPRKIWKIPGYFSLDAGYDSNYNEGQALHTAEVPVVTGVGVQKYRFVPKYSLKLLNTPWVKTTIDLASYYNIYEQSKDPADYSNVINSRLNLNYNMVKVTMNGPGLSKVFKVGRARFKHAILPKFEFRYTTKYKDEDLSRVPTSSRSDYPSFSYMKASLISKLYYKGPGQLSPKEVVDFSLSQTYYFDPALAANNYSSYKIDNGRYPQFSELYAKATVKPIDNFSISAGIKYNHYIEKNNFTSIDLSAKFVLPDDYGDFSVRYGSNYNPYLPENNRFKKTEALTGNLYFDFKHHLPVKLLSRVDYDIVLKEFRNFTNVVTFKYQCINFLFKYKILKRFGQLDSEFSLGFTFGNMGGVSSFLDNKEKDQ